MKRHNPPRFFVDQRVGIVAIRDNQHPEYDIHHQGLNSELPDVVEYQMGKWMNREWHIPVDIIISFHKKCRILNEEYNKLSNK